MQNEQVWGFDLSLELQAHYNSAGIFLFGFIARVVCSLRNRELVQTAFHWTTPKAELYQIEEFGGRRLGYAIFRTTAEDSW